MRVVALISGGKDSCFNMMQCVAAGHEIVGLANLQPAVNDEIDSYMYQTVGHDGIDLYADALGLPLYRRKIEGNAIVQQKDYSPTEGDEVEDLYQLLLEIKEELEFDAIAVGAILSDYQRIRVENVCTRLGCVCLAYLWRRDQAELLQEMIDTGINAIIIKTASLGLDPDIHLGQTITEMKKILLSGKKKYGLNVCGEGGEYETFTLDCPLFQQAIVLDEYEKVIHSNDAFAPVGYLKLNRLHLVKKTAKPNTSEPDKESLSSTPTECETENVNEGRDELIESASTRQKTLLNGLPIKAPLDYLSDLVECHIADCCDGHMELCSQNHGHKEEEEDDEEENENKCRTDHESVICNHRVQATIKSSTSSSSIPLSLASDTFLPSSTTTTTPTSLAEDKEKDTNQENSVKQQLDLNFIENQTSSSVISSTLPSPSSTATTPTQSTCPCQNQNNKSDREKFDFPVSLRVTSNAGGWHWIMGIHDHEANRTKRNRRDDGGGSQIINNSSNSNSSSVESSSPMKNALNSLLRVLEERNLRVNDLVGVVIYVSDMSDYAQYNKEYLKIFSSRPPVRICVEAPLPSTIPVLLEALAYRNPNQNQSSSCLENIDSNSPTRQCMHVQGISHWAPANIGPYSQAIWVGDIIYVAGQIGLVPGSMTLVEGGARIECKLALRHINRIIKAVDSKVEMRDVVQGICYVTDAKFIEECRREWEKRTNNAIVEYLVVPRLPRDANVEWQVWAHKHNTAFEYEETGCYIGTEVKLRMIRRWNYECRVAVIVCTASICTPGSRFGRSEMIEMTEYALNKLNQESDEKSQNECAIRVFYRIGTSLNPSDLNEVLGHQSAKFNVAFSIIPVSFLVKDNAVISFCGVRHQ